MQDSDCPIFCDGCPRLAVAELENEFLCIGCLLDKLRASPEMNKSDKIKPLRLEANTRRSHS